MSMTLDVVPALTRPAPSARTDFPPRRDTTAPRFTVDGSVELEGHLAKTCEKIAAGIRGIIPGWRLQAVLLGGGYGRGEGGVLRTRDGDKPYNDLEFYVCLRGNRHLNERRFGRALHVLGEILTPQAGVEVEFKITSLRELMTRPVSMFSYDLVAGHRWLIGNEALLARCAHHRDAGQIPLAEATRLLMNRCSGLLFAAERLRRASFTGAEADFARRNIAKAQLALGDAVLVAYGQYHHSVAERHERLARIVRAENTSWMDEVLTHHGRGVEFKLHPFRSAETRETLAAAHGETTELAWMTWRWIESRRLHAAFRNAEEYVDLKANKCADGNVARNVLHTLKVVGPTGAITTRSWRHPRSRVLDALVALLWVPSALTNPVMIRRLQRGLSTRETQFAPLVSRYQEIWAHVN